MTSISMQPRPRRETGALAQDGPVLLATKPFNGLDAPVTVARWLAARERRRLRVVSVLEPTDGIVSDGVSPLSPPYYGDERSALAAQIRRELVIDDTGTDSLQVDVLEGPGAHIVVGTGRHDPIGRYLYGERALQIVARADRPVLVVPREAVAAPLSVAVVAIDFTPASL